MCAGLLQCAGDGGVETATGVEEEEIDNTDSTIMAAFENVSELTEGAGVSHGGNTIGGSASRAGSVLEEDGVETAGVEDNHASGYLSCETSAPVSDVSEVKMRMSAADDMRQNATPHGIARSKPKEEDEDSAIDSAGRSQDAEKSANRHTNEHTKQPHTISMKTQSQVADTHIRSYSHKFVSDNYRHVQTPSSDLSIGIGMYGNGCMSALEIEEKKIKLIDFPAWHAAGTGTGFVRVSCVRVCVCSCV